AGLANGAMHGTNKGIHPAQATAVDCVDTTGTCNTQRRGTGEAVHCGPYRVTGNLRRVGEEQEGTAGQCGVEEFLAGTAKDLLADDHTEADTQGDLPERNARRQDQRKEHRGDEEALVDLMLADGGEEHLPEAADNEGHGIDRHEPGGAM